MLLLQQVSFRVHRPEVRLVLLAKLPYTISPECDHS